MTYILMHKNVKVLSFSLNRFRKIETIADVYSVIHIPLGVVPEVTSLQSWWQSRAISPGRDGIWEDLSALNIGSPMELLPLCSALSLCDHYWIRPAESKSTWEEINFFNHPFVESFGHRLLGESVPVESYHTPDVTLEGFLRKRWTVRDGKRYLIKAGSAPYFQEPINEFIASQICEQLGIPCVPYTVTWENDTPYSICESFVDENTELVPASQIIQTQKKNKSTSYYKHFVNCAESLGIPGMNTFLDRMIVLDYIIANEDRHLNNFGALRNAETLEWIGMAPLFDNGSSLGYSMTEETISKTLEPPCKPFANTWKEQLSLISDISCVDLTKLDIKEIEFYMEDYKEKERIGTSLQMLKRRAINLTCLKQRRYSNERE